MKYLLFIVFVACWSNLSLCESPYQVSLRLNNPNPSQPISFCNGAIIHESYVLTSAHCMFDNNSYPLQPNQFFIVAGNFTLSPYNTRQIISAIYVHEQYNKTSWQNDIALLKLSQPLPLRNNTQIRWLQLDSGRSHHENCWASFSIPSARGYPYTSPQQSNVMDNYFCNSTSQSNASRRDQICAHYVFADSLMCRAPAYELLLSEDRGTPLICTNVLTGILSTVLPPSNLSSDVILSCLNTRKTYAYYTKVSLHERWINEKISLTQPSGQPSITPPFTGQTGTGTGIPVQQQPSPQQPQHPQQPQQPQHPQQSPPQRVQPPKKNSGQSIAAWSLSSIVALYVAKVFM